MELEGYAPSTLPCKGNVFLTIPKPQKIRRNSFFRITLNAASSPRIPDLIKLH